MSQNNQGIQENQRRTRGEQTQQYSQQQQQTINAQLKAEIQKNSKEAEEMKKEQIQLYNKLNSEFGAIKTKILQVKGAEDLDRIVALRRQKWNILKATPNIKAFAELEDIRDDKLNPLELIEKISQVVKVEIDSAYRIAAEEMKDKLMELERLYGRNVVRSIYSWNKYGRNLSKAQGLMIFDEEDIFIELKERWREAKDDIAELAKRNSYVKRNKKPKKRYRGYKNRKSTYDKSSKN